MNVQRTPGEDFCKQALGWSMRHQDVHDVPLHAQTEERDCPMGDQSIDDGVTKLPRISIDFKVPIWALISVVGVAVLGGMKMYFTMEDVQQKVGELRVYTEGQRAWQANYSSEQALIKYRIEKLETDKEKK
jgi:hypothetical protein